MTSNPNQYEPQIALCTKCRKHGNFTMPQGMYSPEFCSVEGAKEVINGEHVQFWLNQLEIQKLRELLESSELPTLTSEADQTTQEDVEGWNETFKVLTKPAIKFVLVYRAHDYRLRVRSQLAAQIY